MDLWTQYGLQNKNISVWAYSIWDPWAQGNRNVKSCLCYYILLEQTLIEAGLISWS